MVAQVTTTMKSTLEKQAVVDQAREAREQRKKAKEDELKKQQSAKKMVIVHKVLLRKIAQYQTANRLRSEFDCALDIPSPNIPTATNVLLLKANDLSTSSSSDTNDVDVNGNVDVDGAQADVAPQLTSSDLFKAIQKLRISMMLDDGFLPQDSIRMITTAKAILTSMNNAKTSYTSLCLKDSIKWATQVKWLVPLLLRLAIIFSRANLPSLANIGVLLAVVFRLLDHNSWGLTFDSPAQKTVVLKALTRLCGLLRAHVIQQSLLENLSEIVLGLSARRSSLVKPTLLEAIIRLGVFPTLRGDVGAPPWIDVVKAFFVVPAFTLEVSKKCPAVFKEMTTHQLAWKSIRALQTSDHTIAANCEVMALRMAIFFNTSTANFSLSTASSSNGAGNSSPKPTSSLTPTLLTPPSTITSTSTSTPISTSTSTTTTPRTSTTSKSTSTTTTSTSTSTSSSSSSSSTTPTLQSHKRSADPTVSGSTQLVPLHGSTALVMIGNIVHATNESLADASPADLECYIDVVSQLMQVASAHNVNRKSNITQEHPILGAVTERVPRLLLDVLPMVSIQIKILWSSGHIKTVFKPCLDELSTCEQQQQQQQQQQYQHQHQHTSSMKASKKSSSSSQATSTSSLRSSSNSKTKSGRSLFAKSMFARVSRAISRPHSQTFSTLEASEMKRMAATCQLYSMCSATLRHHQAEILSTIAFSPGVVPALWNYLPTLGPRPAMSVFLNPRGIVDQSQAKGLLDLLCLACQLANLLITVLSDDELHDKEDPISVQMLIEISQFLSEFVFKALWHYTDSSNRPLHDPTTPLMRPEQTPAVKYATTLLSTMYDCDCRRKFSQDGHWLTKLVSTRQFETELDKERFVKQGKQQQQQQQQQQQPSYDRAHQVLQRIPHALPHRFRVRLFRDEVVREKSVLTGNRARYLVPHITIHRSALLMDGFRQISTLKATDLKDTIKIKFINHEGLDEAGIDENGVFKEFLEDCVKTAFDPNTSLFTTTPNNHLYPNPCAYYQDNHLELFEFVGKLLGKAVYEGHLLEIPFAQFFLNTLVGRTNTLDELPMLDSELAKNLSFVKTYEGDVADLDLCFAIDEEVFGKMESRQLIVGGEGVAVTNDNRILYCHLMADYRLNKQFKKFSAQFIKGFQSVISLKWLACFSAPDIQRLISGDNVRLDVEDLKKHVSYLGGYSSSHRSIRWLWQVVGEMEAEEQSKFLKFVTSCSKPPVLGFSTLEPRFSIRAVHDGSHEDSYTLGSVVANYFRPGTNTDRLPTSSTCFNLLKLPMYKSKRVLKEKLKYSINSGAGFELS